MTTGGAVGGTSSGRAPERKDTSMLRSPTHSAHPLLAIISTALVLIAILLAAVLVVHSVLVMFV
jgi:hypothetical protein